MIPDKNLFINLIQLNVNAFFAEFIGTGLIIVFSG